MKTSNNNFYDVNFLINANTTEMVDGSKWIVWAKDQLKNGLPKRNLNKIAELLTK